MAIQGFEALSGFYPQADSVESTSPRDRIDRTSSIQDSLSGTGSQTNHFLFLRFGREARNFTSSFPWTGISHSGAVYLAMGVRSYGFQKSYGLVKVKLSEFYFQSGITTD
ncbi:hypothetical protein FRX31_013625 [Thalictrum thalictroides]|uniref:Uncharacterized protein n=1 Tax=Thalictrum thalictroides TaxID=46969 RepID=A0A7J6WIM3_THATH|nr:hypothetical protein FRX31_013625 [Thalictrum thalictroides]